MDTRNQKKSSSFEYKNKSEEKFEDEPAETAAPNILESHLEEIDSVLKQLSKYENIAEGNPIRAALTLATILSSVDIEKRKTIEMMSEIRREIDSLNHKYEDLNESIGDLNFKVDRILLASSSTQKQIQAPEMQERYDDKEKASPALYAVHDEELSETEERILELAKRRGRICAQEVQKDMGYSGKNAAAARLNRLYRMGLLRKKRGEDKVMYYMLT